MELILIPNSGLLYLGYNGMDSFKSVFLKKVMATNIIVIKIKKNKVGVYLVNWRITCQLHLKACLQEPKTVAH